MTRTRRPSPEGRVRAAQVRRSKEGIDGRTSGEASDGELAVPGAKPTVRTKLSFLGAVSNERSLRGLGWASSSFSRSWRPAS